MGLILVFLLLSATVIIWFSSKSGPESSVQSEGVTLHLARTFYRDFDDLPEIEQRRIIYEWNPYVRKAAHVIEFAVLSVGVTILFVHLGSFKRYVLWAFLTGAVIAAGDELFQLSVSGRDASIRDVGIDCIGVALGVMIGALITHIGRKRRYE